ncbi:uncharacterized protein [Nicotiana sylvestris]|uniref:uncharacterized protein n=1 Tax=Nicotiana sylvestris TaxID=4096 RepID=UPI00388CB2BC
MTATDYFSKLRGLWDEFDAIMPCPSCPCPESRKYLEHFEYQRLMQFLTGLNESYSQAKSQITMMHSTLFVNKAYYVIIDQESQRNLANFTQISQVTEAIQSTALFSNKSGNFAGSNFKPGPNRNIYVCEYCHLKGHTKENCYKLIGYPPDFKSKKRGRAIGTGNSYANQAGWMIPLTEDVTCEVNGGANSVRKHGQQPPVKGGFTSMASAQQQAPATFFTLEQYWQIIQMLNKGSDEGSSTKSATAGTETDLMSIYSDREWIVDTGASNHMASSLQMLKAYILVPKSKRSNVHLPAGWDLFNGQVKEIGRKKHGLYVLQEKQVKASCQYPKQQVNNNTNTGSMNKTSHVYMSVISDSSSLWHKRFPSRVIYFKSPFEMFYFHAPSPSHLKVFGWLCYVVVPKCMDKFTSKAIPAVLVGYSSTQKGYKLYSLLLVSRNVVFKEDIFPFKHLKSADVSPLLEPSNSMELRRSSRISKPPAWLQDYVTKPMGNSYAYLISSYVTYSHLKQPYQHMLALHLAVFEPKTFRESVSDPKWV